MFRVIVAGGRDFNDYNLLRETLDVILANVNDNIAIVCGMANGADTLGETYAKERGHTVCYFPAEWNTYGRAAGYMRNAKMAQNADALVAFWDGKSRGTKHMIDIAKWHKLDIRVVRYDQGSPREVHNEIQAST